MDSNTTSSGVSIKTFINTVFPPDLLGDEIAVLAHPDSFTKDGETVDFYRKVAWTGRNRVKPDRAWYMCISSAAAADKPKTRMEDIRCCFVIVLDDIGTKSSEPPVAPSYKLETSAGNFQYGYLIDPYDVSDTAGQRYVDDVLTAAADAGFNDQGCRNPTRLVRVVGSLHRTGFVARLTEWHPERVWALPELAKALGLKVRRRRLKNRLERLDTPLEEVRDPVLDYLYETGRVKSVNEAWVHIECPWADRHTTKSTSTATGYSPDGYGFRGAAFRCLHGHCRKRGAAEFTTWVLRERNRNSCMNTLTGE